VTGAVTASTLTTVCVFLPIVFVEGVAGQVFRDQSLAVVISLVASLLVSLYVLPALVARRPQKASAGAGGGCGRRPRRPRFEARARLVRDVAFLARWWRGLTPVVRIVSSPLAVLGITLAALAFPLRLALEAAAVMLTACLSLLFLLGRKLAPLGRGRLGRAWGGVERFSGRAFESLSRSYLSLLDVCLLHRGAVLGVLLIAGAGAAYSFFQLGAELIPEVHQGEFTVDLRLPVGTRLERTDEVVAPWERRILAEKGLLGLASVTTTIGVEKDSIKAGEEGEHTAKILVRLERGANPRHAEERVKARLRDVLSGEPELQSAKLQSPVLFSFKTPIEVEVKGYNLTDLRRITDDVETALRSIPSLKDVKSNMGTGYPEAHLRFDRDLLSRYGLTVSTVGNAIRRMVQGDVASWFNEGDRKVGIRVRLEEEDRRSLEDLAALVLNPESPAPLALKDVLLSYGGQIEVGEGPAEIRRVAHQRAGVVTANLTGMDLGRVTEEIVAALGRIERPADFTIGFGGQKEEMDISTGSLFQALVLAIFLVYVVMAIQFESLVQPFIIILVVPLAMVGVSPVLWALGIPLSILVFIGMIILAGIVVNNAIVLVDYTNQLRVRGMALREALSTAGSVRLRPILMTTLTTVLGLLPLTGIFDGVPALGRLLGAGEGVEMRAPLAITVIAGLSASTALTLVVVPVIYSLFMSAREGRPSSAAAPPGDGDPHHG
jgi:HAE1 family hydrophobic/amphiphilic exporter-1